MHTSKLTSLHILFGMLLLMGALSMPAQAKTVNSGNRQVGRLFAEKPPTNTKKAKATSAPKKTATPRPAVTRTPVSQNTSAPVASSTPRSQPTQINATDAPSSTPNGTVTASTVVTSAFSATPTALGISTVVARRTETAASSFETSTALASIYSPTPTNIGAPTATETSTPSASESTATSAALTTSPIANVEVSITYMPASPTSSPTAVSMPASFKQVQTPQVWRKMSWILGAPVLLVLAFLTYREWKKYSPQQG